MGALRVLAAATRLPVGPRGDGPAHDPAPRDAEPKDAGGGFGGLVRQAGVYVVTGETGPLGTAVDSTIVVLASLGLARLLVRTWTRRRLRQ